MNFLRKVILGAALVLGSVGGSGCASVSANLAEMDVDYQMHPGMDLRSSLAPKATSYLTSFDAGLGAQGRGACTTCAH